MIVRSESWGAWIKLEREVETPTGKKQAIVALDREALASLGIVVAPGSVRTPLEAHVAITSRCSVGCSGCYLETSPHGTHVSFEAIDQLLLELARAKVFTVAFGGGEPLTHPALGSIAERAKEYGLTPVVTTSGIGLNEARIEALRPFAQVNVSYDGQEGVYESVRGVAGAMDAERAISRLSDAGIRVGVNTVLTQSSFPHLEETVLRARDLGASEVQLLRYKPAGNAASLDYYARRLRPDQVRAFAGTIRALIQAHAGPGFSVRIDCALVPFLSTDELILREPARLRRLGILGCEAGDALLAVRADGHLAGCSFADPSLTKNFANRDSDPVLAKWREPPEAEPCRTCPLRPTCKGGCKVVRNFLEQTPGPDPECPRVQSWTGVS